MPLIKGKSPVSFGKNVRTEMNAGKPQKQALAIAYSMKRKAERHKAHGGSVLPHSTYQNDTTTMNDPTEMTRLAKGGMCEHGGPKHCNMGCYADGGDTGYDPVTPSQGGMMHKKKILNHMMAEGGQITDNYQSPDTSINQTKDEAVDPEEEW